MKTECTLSGNSPEPFSTNMFGIKERPDGHSVQVEVYHPAHNAKVTIDGVGHSFSLAELIIMGHGNFLVGLDRITDACTSLEDYHDKHIRSYFHRQAHQKAQIETQIAEKYFSQKED